MSNSTKELRQERGQLVADMRALVDLAETEKRDMTDDESNTFNTMEADQAKIGVRIERIERQRELDRNMADQQAEVRDDSKPAETREVLQMKEARQWVRTGQVGQELRALQANIDTSGGYLLPPEQMVQQLIKAIDDQVFIRQMATVFQVPDADSLGAPTLENDPADADWTTELATGSEDSTMSFGKRSLNPNPVAKLIKVSNKLVAKVASAESLVINRLAYKFAITQEKAFLTGTGADQPLGLFTASANGISTARDVSTGNTSTSIGFDGLIEAKYLVKGAYWPNAAWLFHRDAMKQVTKLKDGDGQYLWRQSVRDGEPDMVLGHRVMVSEYAPSTFTTGLYVGLFGDFSHYWIADSISMQLQRLVELYAATSQIGFIGRLEADGMPVLAEAFARVKLG